MNINILTGHALIGAVGARGINNIKEEVLTRVFADELKMQLEAKGHKVNIIRIDNEVSSYKELNRKVSLANSTKAELNISIHFNSYCLNKANGVEIFTYTGQSIYNASNMLKNLKKLGMTNRGIKNGAGLKVINSTVAKTMLIEFGFLTNQHDLDIISKYGAKGLCKCIADTFPSINQNNELEDLKKEVLFLNNKLDAIRKVLNYVE